MLIIKQLPDVDPAPTKTYHSDNKGTRNVYIRKTDLEKFGYTEGCPACDVRHAGLPMSGEGHTVECRKRLEDVLMTDASTATRIKAQTERIIRDWAILERRTPAVEQEIRRDRCGTEEAAETAKAAR